MNRRGFTLVEIVVVMAIIAVLAVLVTGAISIARKQARGTQRLDDLRTINTAMQAYYAKNKEYPPVDFEGNDACYGGANNKWPALKTALGIDMPVDPICDTNNYYAYWTIDSSWTSWPNGSNSCWGHTVLYSKNTDGTVKHRECDGPTNLDIILVVE